MLPNHNEIQGLLSRDLASRVWLASSVTLSELERPPSTAGSRGLKGDPGKPGVAGPAGPPGEKGMTPTLPPTPHPTPSPQESPPNVLGSTGSDGDPVRDLRTRKRIPTINRHKSHHHQRTLGAPDSHEHTACVASPGDRGEPGMMVGIPSHMPLLLAVDFQDILWYRDTFLCPFRWVTVRT